VTLGTAIQQDSSPILLAADSGGGGGGGATAFLLLLGVLAFSYLILVRPQRKRMKQLQKTQSSLTEGAEVMTTAGLYATVVEFDDETVTLETAPGVHNRYVRAAVAKIITPVDEVVDETDDETGNEIEDEIEDEIDEAAEDDGDTPRDASRPKR